MKSSLQRLYKSKFVHNVAVVGMGTAAAQIIIVAFSPILTRLYGAEAFGILGVFMAVIAVVRPVSALTYPMAIVLPKSDGDAKELIKLSLIIALIVACIASLVLFFFQSPIVELLQIEIIASYLFLIPVVVLFIASLQVSKQWLIRKKQFSLIAKGEALKAFIENSTKAGIGFFYPFAVVLVSLAAFGQLLHAGILAFGGKMFQTLQYNNSTDLNSGTTSTVKDIAYHHRDFPFYRAPQMIINAVSQHLPILMLTSFFGLASAGFYAICTRVLKMPSQLIGKSVKDVFYPRITEAAHKGDNLSKLILKATLSMAGIGFLPFALVVAFGPWLFEFVFGTDWSTAGEYARWLSFWLFFAFINRPSVAAIPVMNLQGYFLIYEIISVVLRVNALFIGFYMFANDILAIILYSIAGVVLNIFLILITILRSNNFQSNKEASAK